LPFVVFRTLCPGPWEIVVTDIAPPAAPPVSESLPIAEIAVARLAAATMSRSVSALLSEAFAAVETPAATAIGRLYVESVAVTDYRGIGERTWFRLAPRPGVTLVVGRNGAGKSSLAEALETAFTGTNSRWERQDDARRGSWRNLRAGATPKVEVKLSVAGDAGLGQLTRTWPADDFETSTGVFKRHGDPAVPARDAPWVAALREYRPFLSYADLGNLISDKASRQYDAVDRILGLGYLVEVDTLLKAEQSRLTAAAKRVDEELTALEAALEDLPDEDRATASIVALGSKKKGPDFTALDALLANLPAADDDGLAELRLLASMRGPEPERVVEAADRLRAAVTVAASVRGTSAEDATHRADLLDRALGHLARHAGDTACPVCGTAGALSASWAAQATAQVDALREEGRAAVDASRQLATAENALRALIQIPEQIPPALSAQWAAWERGRTVRDPALLAQHAPGVARALADACAVASREAAAQLAARDEKWRPLYTRLATWTEQARAAAHAAPRRADLVRARRWLDALIKDLRAKRLARFEAQAQQIWEQLRQESGISLAKVRLDGKESSNLRKLILDVSLDDARAPALAVMSQGEQHSLALALFLPRARTADSPFGFLLIDDPVQSMDPAKVHGLARVLHELGEERQIIVFTHDTRLQRAFASQELAVTVFEVERDKGSKVRVKPVTNPVEQALEDARALAKTSNLPLAALSHVLPGLCRLALENAFIEAAWIRQYRSGGSEQELQALIARADRFIPLASLALFGDTGHTKPDVEAELAKVCPGGWHDVDLVRQCQAGSHPGGAQIADPSRFVYRLSQIADAVRRPAAVTP
jgi:recombinational DNA repair ATPase RecF